MDKLNVLSLFDGISCGQVALERSGINVNNYYASEIDKYAIKVTTDNYPDTIQLGDVTKWQEWDIDWSSIDLLIGGSPCQGFSMAGKQLNFGDERSKLFFTYVDILQNIGRERFKACKEQPKFLLENVKMKKQWVEVINKYLDVDGVFINSKLVSAQNRPRWYWTNIANIEQPSDKNILLCDILEDEVDEKYFIKSGRLAWLQRFGEVKEKGGYIAFNPTKGKCLTVRPEPSWNCTYILQWPRGTNNGGIRAKDGKTPSLTTSSWPANTLLLKEEMVRKLTPIECERLQTLLDNYTKSISDTQRYKALGNGWTVDVIFHIFEGLK